MRNFALFVITALLATSAHAANFQVERREHKFALGKQSLIQRQTITAPIVATTNYILTTNAGATSAAAASVTSFAHQPDVPRNLTVTPTGTTGDVESCVVTVSGTDIFGASISEGFTFAADASTAQTGSKAFKTVTSVAWAASCESGGYGATWIVGVGAKLGLERCMDNAGDLIFSEFNGAYETTRGTAAVSASAVSGNTFTPNGTPDGAKDVIVNYVQNFGCYP